MDHSSSHFDIVIIGSGAGGGTIAMKLAPTGKRIAILERGDFIPREKENWDPVEVATKGRYRTKELWLDKDDQPFEPYTHYCVGGNTKMYGAALLRFRKSDFDEVKHFDGMSPAWPVSYDDLEPYYAEAEHIYSVHGEKGVDPTEPPSSAPYLFPPLQMEPDMKELHSQFVKQGCHPFPCPIAVRLNTASGQSAIHLSNFDGFPDLTEAKADAQVVGIKSALQYDNVSLVTNCRADKLLTSADGKKVVAVEVSTIAGKQIIYASTIIVAAGAVNTAALFLRSKNEMHPGGLANSSNQVGRNYMAHNNGALIVISRKSNNSQFQKTFGIADFYHGSENSKYPLGVIQLMGRTDADSMESLTENLKLYNTTEEFMKHSVDFWLTAEDLPHPDNRVTITEEDQIKLSVNPKNREAYDRLKQQLKELIEKIGENDPLYKEVEYTGYDLGVSGVSHQNGTMRFGNDASSSVLDVNCKTHDLENVYVVDASFFPSCGAVNPALTIMANALRVGEHLIRNVFHSDVKNDADKNMVEV